MARNFAARNLQLILSLALLLVLVVFAALSSNQKQALPYDLDSASSDGLRALRLWLEKMGYTVERTGNRAFALPDHVDLIFIYPNQEFFSDSDAALLGGWVTAGHTLVLIGPDASDVALVHAFGVTGQLDNQLPEEVTQQQPLLPAADVTFRALGSGVGELSLEQAPGAVPVLATRNQISKIAVQHVGRGTVWHLSSDFTLTNEQLHDQNVAALVPALLRTVPPNGKLLFDTYHLYGPDPSMANGKQISTLQEWLYGTPFGWAILFAAGITLLYLFLQGWRLGPALPSLTETRRREAAEYVAAMGTLYRRAQQREAVAQHHKRRLKLGLGHALHISPQLSDSEFVQQLLEPDKQLADEDVQSIRQLLDHLDDQATEGALVHMAAKVDEILAVRR